MAKFYVKTETEEEFELDTESGVASWGIEIHGKDYKFSIEEV